MSQSKYNSLIHILDQLRKEAPPEYKKYHAIETDHVKLNQARSRAFIHLFLKVRFGILEFKEREYFITDQQYDGGIDAYYINSETKQILFIQSKFRTTENNFQEKEITLDELLNMDVDRISEGQTADENGNEYNGKIKQLQRDMSNIADIGRYSYEVILLANLINKKASDLRKLTGGFSATVFDHNKTYSDLVFPVVSGTYYNESELCIRLNLSNITLSSSRISYNVNTKFKSCDISIVFVPTVEIGKILYKYKNSILKYNPRSYLELSNNTVNKEISKTIVERKTNEFALFNNGITMLSEGTNFNERVGVKDLAQVVVTNPQIINGGQTAYTLSRLYQDTLKGSLNQNIFDNKEVLVKIITFNIEPEDNKRQQLSLIEEISKATNQQTPVDEADRRSNDKIQLELQKILFEKYGYYYERKRGEFADGVREKYINRSNIIDRDTFLRICIACDFRPSFALRSSGQLFKESNFSKTLSDINRADEYIFAYQCYILLNEIEKTFSRDINNQFGVVNYGQALRYGKYAVISVCIFYYLANFYKSTDQIVNLILSLWLKFEEFAVIKPTNKTYFRAYVDQDTNEKHRELNYSGYYKGRTLDTDLKDFFIQRPLDEIKGEQTGQPDGGE
jgi:hypothetical protein